jgi:hypothetical protein
MLFYCLRHPPQIVELGHLLQLDGVNNTFAFFSLHSIGKLRLLSHTTKKYCWISCKVTMSEVFACYSGYGQIYKDDGLKVRKQIIEFHKSSEQIFTFKTL